MSNTIQVAGMDPSLSNFGVVEAYLDIITLKITPIGMYVVKTEPEKDKKARKVVRKNSEDLERVKLLHKGATDAAKLCKIAFVEVPVGSQSARAMASYGACLGVIAAVDDIVPIIQVTPTEVKVAGCGIKTASKSEMIEAMIAKYPDADWPMRNSKGQRVPIAGECEHLADALAAIEAGVETAEFRQLVAMMQRIERVA